MPKDDRDVFDYFRADQDSPIEIDLPTYALYAFEKYQWHEQFQLEHGRPPDPADIDRWINDITPNRFKNMREEAARLFDNSARTYLADEIEAQKQQAVRSSILNEVKAAGAFWRQMAVALVTAILAPLIIGGLIAAALTYDRVIPSASEISRLMKLEPEQNSPAH